MFLKPLPAVPSKAKDNRLHNAGKAKHKIGRTSFAKFEHDNLIHNISTFVAASNYCV
jgi:hypothetical protein